MRFKFNGKVKNTANHIRALMIYLEFIFNRAFKNNDVAEIKGINLYLSFIDKSGKHFSKLVDIDESINEVYCFGDMEFAINDILKRTESQNIQILKSVTNNENKLTVH